MADTVASDMEAVARFLRTAVATVEEEMEAAANSRAWDGWRGLAAADGEEDEKEVVRVNTVDVTEGFAISDLGWSSAGFFLSFETLCCYPISRQLPLVLNYSTTHMTQEPGWWSACAGTTPTGAAIWPPSRSTG